MLFLSLRTDQRMFQRDSGVDLMQQYSVEDAPMQTPAKPFRLFGRQVGQMNTQCPKLYNLPSHQYLYQPSEDFPRRFNLRDELQGTTKPKTYVAAHIRSTEEMELSLGTGPRANAKDIMERNWVGGKHFRTEINLEEPTRLIPSGKETESCFRKNLGSEVFLSSVQTILKSEKPEQSLDGEKGASFHQGIKGGNDDMSSSKQELVSCLPGTLDLNKVPFEEPVLNIEECFIQDLNQPYNEDGCEKSVVEDPAQFDSSKSINSKEKTGMNSPDSYSSRCIRDKDGSRTESDSSNKILGTHVRSHFPEILSAETKNGGSCDKKTDLDETDPFVQIAAESLIQISFNCSAESLEFPPSCDAEPECSLDSYEKLTLKIAETSPEDFCVSSKPTFENNKECGLKLKRGRRMKNFQKEILPGLVSLSRHEIREDVNILEAVLRSREYRKNRGRMGETDQSEPLLKNKRSRTRCIGGRRR